MVKMAWYDTAQILALKHAIRKKDWFTAIVLSATQIERHGYLEIKAFLKSMNIDSDLVDKILKKTYLSQIAGYLLTIKRIDKNEYTAIMEINKARNKFVHRREKEEFERGAEAKKKYEPLVNEAIRILREKLNAERLFIMK